MFCLCIHKAFLPRSEREVKAKVKKSLLGVVCHTIFFYVLKGQRLCGTNLINRSQKYCIQFLRKHSGMLELRRHCAEMPVVLRCFVLQLWRWLSSSWITDWFSPRKKKGEWGGVVIWSVWKLILEIVNSTSLDLLSPSLYRVWQKSEGYQ